MALQASSSGLSWYLQSRFGMFIHWGLYALLARGEWVMHTESIAVAEYEKLAQQFNPTKFNADEWVAIAADAGQKWITITSRHHDGFSMYDTALSNYKVTNTPFKRDPLRELADAVARRRDIKLGFYSSLLDWHHPAYRFRAERGLAWGDYLGFLHGQVRELCTQYGEVCSLWFDGDWPTQMHQHPPHFHSGGSFEYDRLYDMIHALQPGCIVHNNRHTEPLPGEDVQGFEQDLPGSNTAGFNDTRSYGLPIETCMTINDGVWGFDARDKSLKSTRHLIHVIARLAAVGSNFLLNVGPTADGEIFAAHAERLRSVGTWLRTYGESIYNTQAGAFGIDPDVASTRRGKTHFVHSLNYISDEVDVPAPQFEVKSARLLTGEPVPMRRTKAHAGERLRLFVPARLRDPHDTVVAIQEA